MPKKPHKRNAIGDLPAAFRTKLFENLGGVGRADDKSTWTYAEAVTEIRKAYNKRVSITQLSTWYKKRGREELEEQRQAAILERFASFDEQDEVPVLKVAKILLLHLFGKELNDEETKESAATVRALTGLIKELNPLQEAQAEIERLKSLINKGPEEGQSVEDHREAITKGMDQLLLGAAAES